jgi:hypothetical protein
MFFAASYPLGFYKLTLFLARLLYRLGRRTAKALDLQFSWHIQSASKSSIASAFGAGRSKSYLVIDMILHT